jgi:uncharacterized membrane protein
MTLIGLSFVVAIAYYVLSTTWLLIALIAVVTILILLGVFFAGVYVARDMMQRGADIVLKGQQINDQWDTAKMKGLADFGKEIIRVKTDSVAASQQLPALPPLTAIDGSFTIAGLDEVEQ